MDLGLVRPLPYLWQGRIPSILRGWFACMPRGLRPAPTGPSDSDVTRCLITWAKGLKALVRTGWAGWAMCWAGQEGDHIAWWRPSQIARDKENKDHVPQTISPHMPPHQLSYQCIYLVMLCSAL